MEINNINIDYINETPRNGKAVQKSNNLIPEISDAEVLVNEGVNTEFSVIVVNPGVFTEEQLVKSGIDPTGSGVYKDPITEYYYILTTTCQINGIYKILVIDNTKPGNVPNVSYKSTEPEIVDVLKVGDEWFIKVLSIIGDATIEVSSIDGTSYEDLNIEISDGEINL